MKQDSRLEALLKGLRRLLRKSTEPPGEDPYSYVGAPKKPNLPRLSAAAAVKLEDAG